MDDDTTPDFLAQWVEKRERELAASVQRIQENLLPTEPLQWEIQKAKEFHHNLLCKDYGELWDDLIAAKKALQAIANLDLDMSVCAIGMASAALEGLDKCK